MVFEVIPAIDVSGGRLVRMSARGTLLVDAFGGDPTVAASSYVDAGANRLHVVDVDLALSGTPGNLGTLRDIVALGVPVQASGAVRTRERVGELLAAGAERVVLGSGALADRPGTERTLRALGERICVGIETDGETIRARGNGEPLPLRDTLAWLSELDVPRYVRTDVGRVGVLAGPDLGGIRMLATTTGRPVIASGGIRSVADLRALAGLGGTVEGAIVGRALHEGLDLREALEAVR